MYYKILKTSINYRIVTIQECIAAFLNGHKDVWVVDVLLECSVLEKAAEIYRLLIILIIEWTSIVEQKKTSRKINRWDLRLSRIRKASELVDSCFWCFFSSYFFWMMSDIIERNKILKSTSCIVPANNAARSSSLSFKLRKSWSNQLNRLRWHITKRKNIKGGITRPKNYPDKELTVLLTIMFVIFKKKHKGNSKHNKEKKHWTKESKIT